MPPATEAAKQERRKAPRGQTLKAGTISINRAGGNGCRVRNMSPAGACLEVSSQVGIPNDFILVVDCDKFNQGVPRRLAFGHATRR